MSKPEESSYQPANQNQKDNTMANKFDDPGMTAAAVAEVAVETAKAAPTTSALKSFLAGGVGGIAAVLVGHPLDLVKVRMQTGTGAGASVFGILKNTLATEGTRGLYRGVSAPLIAVSPIYAISFWGYDIGQRIVRLFHPHDSPFTIPELCVAGGISALPSTALMAPTERIKCLLQVQTHSHGKPQYSGMIDCARQVFQKGGVPSLYKGTGLTLMRDVPGSIAWFGVYEVCKKQMVVLTGVRDVAQLSPLSIMVSGGFAGMACWSVSIPADVLKSRYQTAPDGKYHGIGDVYRTLMREEGPTALFTGIRPAMIRAFPANAACFLGMEMARKSLAFLD